MRPGDGAGSLPGCRFSLFRRTPLRRMAFGLGVHDYQAIQLRHIHVSVQDARIGPTLRRLVRER